MGTLVLAKKKRHSGSISSSSVVDIDSDKQLVAKFKAGDLDAFKQLYERYHKRLISVAIGVLNNPEDAEDIVQNAFIKAHRNIASFKGNSSFYTWIYRIVFNLCIDLSRKAYKKRESGTDSPSNLDVLSRASGQNPNKYIGNIIGPESAFKNKNIAERISAALENLSAEHRAAVILREVDGFSYKQISEVLGCSKGTVMSRLHSARKYLQENLKDLL